MVSIAFYTFEFNVIHIYMMMPYILSSRLFVFVKKQLSIVDAQRLM